MSVMNAVAAVTILIGLWTVSAAGQDESQAAGPSFEVASIKRSVPVERQPRGFLPTPGRFTAADVPAASLIGLAYRDAMDEMRGAPEWSAKEDYDVVAPYPPGTAPAYAFDLKFSPIRPGWPEPSDEYPELATALRDQLGLTLVQKKTTARILVVDRFDRPTEN